MIMLDLKIDNEGPLINPNVSSGNVMIAPGSSFRCGFAIELIARY
jgi:hypothetical protein